VPTFSLSFDVIYLQFSVADKTISPKSISVFEQTRAFLLFMKLDIVVES